MQDNVRLAPKVVGATEWLGKPYGGLNIAAWADQETPERQYVLDNFVPRGLLTYITGEGSVGKSLLMQQLCSAIASGRPFLGVPVERARALYITAEDDEKELHKRHKAICATLDTDACTIAKRLCLRSLVGRRGSVALAQWNEGYKDQWGSQDAGYQPSSLMREIEHQIREEGHRLAVLDNASHFFTGNENERSAVADFLRLLHDVAFRNDCAIVLVGFPNKAGAEYSGSTAWSNQVRSRLYLERPAKDTDPDRLRLSNPKANYSPASEITFRFHNLSYVLDRDVPEDIREASRLSAAAASDNHVFLRGIDQLAADDRPVTPNHAPGFAPKVIASMPHAKAQGVTKERLTEAMERLFSIGAIEFVEIGKSAKGDVRKTIRRTPETYTRNLPETVSGNHPKL